MLTIARSKLSLPVQFGFFITNSAGVILAMIYNSKTPDLYPHNSHHSIGWLLTWITIAQICLALIAASARPRGESRKLEEHLPFIQSSPHSVEDLRWAPDAENASEYRFSGDSGHGTEPNTESLRSHSSSSFEDEREVMGNINQKYDQEETDEARGSKRSQHLSIKRLYATLSKKVPLYITSRMAGLLGILESIITRTILIQGFVGIITGAVTYAGIFVCIPNHYI
jgi:hypothetical protein